MSSALAHLGHLVLWVAAWSFVFGCACVAIVYWKTWRQPVTLDVEALERDSERLGAENDARDAAHAAAGPGGRRLRRVSRRAADLLALPFVLPVFVAYRLDLAIRARRQRGHNQPLPRNGDAVE